MERPMSRPRLLLAYHFFHPDDVIGARLFTDLALEQQHRGWEVSALTSNRVWKDPDSRLPSRENWNGIDIHRVPRPTWSQARALQRLGNSGWMLGSWLAKAVLLPRFDAVVVGSDPAFAALLAPGVRVAQPNAALVHWCFDLYPEAIAAERTLSAAASPLVPVARGMMRFAYRHLDALVDLGPRMRERLAEYGSGVRQETLPPWALFESDRPLEPDPAARAALFPRAKLALLYSGNIGRGHDFEAFLRLARACRARAGDTVSLAFSVRGGRFADLRAAIAPDDSNVALVDFAEESALLARLTAADLHLVSLQQEWGGVVVPSKFFASLAIGRPVLYAGPGDSEIARWIDTHDIGLYLTRDTVDAVADRLLRLADDRAALARWRENALAVYRREWSKQVVNDRWDALLRQLVARRGAPSAG